MMPTSNTSERMQVTGLMYWYNCLSALAFVPGYPKAFLLHATKTFFPSLCNYQWVTFMVHANTREVDESMGVQRADDFLLTYEQQVLLKCNRKNGKFLTVYGDRVQDPQDVLGSYGLQDFSGKDIWIQVVSGNGKPSFVVAPNQLGFLGDRIRSVAIEQKPCPVHRSDHRHRHPVQCHVQKLTPAQKYEELIASHPKTKYHTDEVQYEVNYDEAYLDKAFFPENGYQDGRQSRFNHFSTSIWTSSRLPSSSNGPSARQDHLTAPPQRPSFSDGPSTSSRLILSLEVLKEIDEYKRPENLKAMRAKASLSLDSSTSGSSESNESNLRANIAELLKKVSILEEENKKLKKDVRYKNGREENALNVVRMLQDELATTKLSSHLRDHSSKQGNDFLGKLDSLLYKY